MSLSHQIETVRGQRPRVMLNIPDATAYNQQSQQQPSPYILSAATLPSVQGQPTNWNPFLQQMYSQRAGDFMCKQFQGLNRFTRGGLSLGEKSVVWTYTKFREWSRKWFTHCFLIIIMLAYSAAGAYIFMALEGEFLGESSDDCVRETVFTVCSVESASSRTLTRSWPTSVCKAIKIHDRSESRACMNERTHPCRKTPTIRNPFHFMEGFEF